MMSVQYMSKEKLSELEEELINRKTVVRKEIASALEFAKQLGDLSENFEYHDAKDKQAENEKRILELIAIIKDAVIVEEKKGGDKIDIGVSFVASKDGKEFNFRIVGSNEADPLSGMISNESPIGRSFLGAREGEEVVVVTPNGEILYKVVSIK